MVETRDAAALDPAGLAACGGRGSPSILRKRKSLSYADELCDAVQGVLAVLGDANFQFQKPGGLASISHKGKEGYYKALLSCKDLTKIAEETLALGHEVGLKLKAEDIEALKLEVDH